MALQVGDLNRDPKEGGLDPLAVGVGVGLALGGGALGLKYGRQLGLDRRKPKKQQKSGLDAVKKVAKPVVPESKVVDSPSLAERRAAYAASAAKPVEDLPPVTRPTSDVDVVLIRDPNTGELRRPGQSSQDFLAAKIAEQKAPTLVQQQDAVGDVKASLQSTDAVQSASDQRDARLEAVVQRDIDSVKYGKSAVVQEIAQEPARMVRRQGKLVPLNQLQEQAAQIAPPQIGLRQQDPSRFLRKAPSVSAEEINTFADKFDVYGRPIPKAEQTLGLIGPQPRNVYSAETPGPAPANEAQIARRELARRAETLLEDIQTEEQAKGILFELAAQYDPQQALAAKRAELQAKGLKGQRLEKTLAATTGADVRAALEDARLQPGLQTEGAPLKFSREVPNVGPEAVVTKTATGRAIRGAGRLSDEPPAQTRERTLFGDYPDPLVTGQPVDPVPDRPGKETVLGQMVSAPTPRIDKYAETQEGAGGGVGVYGRGTDYVPGAMSKQTGEYSAAASRKPTDVTGFKTLGDQPSPYQALSDEDLGMMSMVGSKEDAYNANKVLASRRSLDVSRDIQRLQRSGRPDAQKMVKDYLNKLQG